VTNFAKISASAAIGRHLLPNEPALFDYDGIRNQLKSNTVHEGPFLSDFPSLFVRDNETIVFRHFGEEVRAQKLGKTRCCR
jgi:hypothetical protein